jgi:hypothetical protein
MFPDVEAKSGLRRQVGASCGPYHTWESDRVPRRTREETHGPVQGPLLRLLLLGRGDKGWRLSEGRQLIVKTSLHR